MRCRLITTAPARRRRGHRAAAQAGVAALRDDRHAGFARRRARRPRPARSTAAARRRRRGRGSGRASRRVRRDVGLAGQHGSGPSSDRRFESRDMDALSEGSVRSAHDHPIEMRLQVADIRTPLIALRSDVQKLDESARKPVLSKQDSRRTRQRRSNRSMSITFDQTAAKFPHELLPARSALPWTSAMVQSTDSVDGRSSLAVLGSTAAERFSLIAWIGCPRVAGRCLSLPLKLRSAAHRCAHKQRLQRRGPRAWQVDRRGLGRIWPLRARTSSCHSSRTRRISSCASSQRSDSS